MIFLKFWGKGSFENVGFFLLRLFYPFEFTRVGLGALYEHDFGGSIRSIHEIRATRTEKKQYLPL